VCVQRMDQGWSVLNDPHARVAMTVNPPLVALGQTKPPLQVEIVTNLFKLGLTHEKPCEKAAHDLGHVLVNRVLGTCEAINQLLVPFLTSRAVAFFGFKSRGHLGDFLDVVSDRLLLGSDGVRSPVDALAKTAELGFREAPFFSSKLRWIESRTSPSASAIRRPGG
jgi:hypothetical protein